MIKVFRAQSPVLLAILFVLISLSFVVFYNIPQLSELRSGHLGKIDDRDLSVEQFRIAQQSAVLSYLLRTGQDLSSGSRSEVLNQLAWQRLLLLAEARRLQINVTDEQIVTFIRDLPFLQKEGKYDPAAYTQFTATFLQSRGLNTARFEQIMREELLMESVRETILSPVQIAPGEIDQMLNFLLGTMKVNLIRLKSTSYTSEVKVDPAQVEKEYQANPQSPAYRTPEKRRVAFVSFPLSPDQLKLKDKPREEALRAVGEKATEFAVAVLEKSETQPDAFTALSQSRGLTTTTTNPFAMGEAPAQYPPSPAFNRAAFQLNADAPSSDAIETTQGFVVMRLVESIPSSLRPLEEVRPFIEANLRARGAQELTQKRGEETAVLLRTALAGGKALPVAAKELKLTVESPAPFSPMQAPANLTDAEEIMGQTRTLPIGQLSRFIATPEGGLLIHLESRTAADKAAAEPLRARVRVQMLSERRTQVMEDWLTTREQRPGTIAPTFIANK